MPDYLVAVDVKMVLEINKTGFQKKNDFETHIFAPDFVTREPETVN